MKKIFIFQNVKIKKGSESPFFLFWFLGGVMKIFPGIREIFSAAKKNF